MLKVTLIGLISFFVIIQPVYADYDLDNGDVLHMENCYGCHDESIYTRPNRIVTSYPLLIQRVRFCSIQRDLSWFEDDILDVAAYLNADFYHFKLK